jgi:valyl-tRNA synthetase
MSLPKRYNPRTSEPAIQDQWKKESTYCFNPNSDKPVFSIDTPPATVSGKLHLGHTYSYSHPDFIARFWRMNGHNVFYPMGYDDNGLPTDRLVERQIGMSAREIGRTSFIKKCLQTSAEAEDEYQELWQRLGLSIDWRFTYRTIDDNSRHIAQLSFLKLFKQGLIYRKEAPTIWCPDCQTAVAQAELDDIESTSEFVTIHFQLENGNLLPIATTRPELLPACVAIFVHPEDERYQKLISRKARVPIFNQLVPILGDIHADPLKGTGVVMCCTFGDQTDVAWWHTHKLPLIEVIDQSGHMTQAAGLLSGLPIQKARNQIKTDLMNSGYQISQSPNTHDVRVHERCDTPVEFIITKQWFTNILDSKDVFEKTGEQVEWHPPHMKSRYRNWVENLSWDWCISRQRYYGIPFPVWYCKDCHETILADEEKLPVEPLDEVPQDPCPRCGGISFEPDPDVMDTWATSSLTPQIAGNWINDPDFYHKVYPFSLRPQAHEIIRTWAFYTIVKSKYHENSIPWNDVLISGWGIAGEGLGKISKSRGGGPLPPLEMIQKYSADAVRYWAASTGPGKDSIISEEKIQIGSKLVNKIWNVARFSSRFIEDINNQSLRPNQNFTPADRWLLSRTQYLIQRVTNLYVNYDYATAKAETETFFWQFADNYIEMAKQRLYDKVHPQREGTRFTLNYTLLTLLKLFAPILSHVTDKIYQNLFVSPGDRSTSIHNAAWPVVETRYMDENAEKFGETLIEIASAVRRYKSERNLSLGSEIKRLQLATVDPILREYLNEAESDLISITRTLQLDVTDTPQPSLLSLPAVRQIKIRVEE